MDEKRLKLRTFLLLNLCGAHLPSYIFFLIQSSLPHYPLIRLDGFPPSQR